MIGPTTHTVMLQMFAFACASHEWRVHWESTAERSLCRHLNIQPRRVAQPPSTPLRRRHLGPRNRDSSHRYLGYAARLTRTKKNPLADSESSPWMGGRGPMTLAVITRISSGSQFKQGVWIMKLKSHSGASKRFHKTGDENKRMKINSSVNSQSYGSFASSAH